MKEKVLHCMLSGGNYVSGEEISRLLGISRTAVWKHIKALKKEGYEIESVPGRGYRVVSLPDLLLPAEISRGLNTSFMGREIYHFDALDSTNEYAKKLAEEGAPEGTVVVAERQLMGKGRLGRKWESPYGGVWLSAVLRPVLTPHRVAGITIATAVAVAEAVVQAAGLTPQIKWPNDILVGGKKICGILTEMKAEMDRVDYVIVGIGINANIDLYLLEKASATASSLSALLGHAVDRKELVRELLLRLEARYTDYCSGGAARIMDIWEKYSCTLNRTVSLKQGDEIFSGFAEDITPEGGLVVKDARGHLRIFYSGEVTVTE